MDTGYVCFKNTIGNELKQQHPPRNGLDARWSQISVAVWKCQMAILIVTRAD